MCATILRCICSPCTETARKTRVTVDAPTRQDHIFPARSFPLQVNASKREQLIPPVISKGTLCPAPPCTGLSEGPQCPRSGEPLSPCYFYPRGEVEAALKSGCPTVQPQAADALFHPEQSSAHGCSGRGHCHAVPQSRRPPVWPGLGIEPATGSERFSHLQEKHLT